MDVQDTGQYILSFAPNRGGKKSKYKPQGREIKRESEGKEKSKRKRGRKKGEKKKKKKGKKKKLEAFRWCINPYI